MLYYVENRVWPLFATINDFIEQTVTLNTDFYQIGPLPLKVKQIKSHIDNYGDTSSDLAIAFPENAVAKIATALESRYCLGLKKIQMIVTNYGFISLASYYEAGNHADFSFLETNGMNIVDEFDTEGLFGLVESLIDQLVDRKVLQKSSVAHFGAPLFVDDRCISAEGYLYNQHIIARQENASVFETIGDFSQMDEGIRVSQGWSLFFWELKQEDILTGFEDMVSIDTLCLSESCLYNNAQRCYIFIIDKVIKGDQRCKPESLRNFFLNNNLHFQKIRLIERDLTEAQSNYVHLYREKSKLDEKYSLYKDGESYIRYSVDGLESSLAERSNRIIQLILAILTCLTLYSIVNDIHSFIVSDELIIHRFVEQSGKSAMLAVVTLLIFVLMYVFQNSLKK